MKKVPETLHRNRMPLYLQMAKLMRQKIESQEWRYGEQIPTLDELEKEYQVSRITLRGALDYLEEFGIIRRTRGRGTFVAKDLSEERWFKLANTLDELVEKVADLNVRLLLIEQAEKPPIPAFPFGEVGTAYRHLKRVHYHKEVPYCVIDLYLDKVIFDSDPQAFSTAPVVSQLARRKDVRIAGAKQVTRVAVADEETAGHLRIGVGEPIADVCRTFVDENDHIIYYAHIQYPTQMIQIETDLMQGAPARRKKTGAKRADGRERNK
ncbi:GntR family transcriptional regulator [Candidimonas humi]|uniref:GntR family transcriptional regulator n=1 Tax=Candidimonas humi TaxID=683355 RepID=A0ABV8NY04_9BURK|nr:GntR family transcriptional regulator [Candidimonas humi]MBV6304844.1 GntR family transcriptional regulator [Candidimonas humi]